MSIKIDEDLDAPLYGVRAIALAANCVKADGTPNTQKAARLLRLGLLDGDKLGAREWTSTKRRLRARFAGNAAA